MKIWTYKEMKQKLLVDLDLQDETFVTPNEMIGYFNEGITEAGSEIIVLNQDYFETRYYVPVLQGQSLYSLPYNIFANKIRGITYSNGTIIYQINQIRRKNKFENIAVINQFGATDWYGYVLRNNYAGPAQLEFHPVMRDTAVLAPVGSLFTPVIMDYLRDCNRVPLSDELCNPEVIATSQVDIAANTIQTYAGSKTYGTPQQGLPGPAPGSIPYVTGDVVQLVQGPGGALPAPLEPDTDYYVIDGGNGVIGLALSLQDALDGTAIDLTDVGTVYFNLWVRATTDIIDATIIDIPEFATFIMTWVKCCCLNKEGDPRLKGELDKLVEQKKQMVDTLTKGIDDDDDTIEADFSSYTEMT